LASEDAKDRMSRNVGKHHPIYAGWHPKAANILNKVTRTLNRVMVMTFTLTHSVQYDVLVYLITQHWDTNKSQGVRGSIEENKVTAHW